MSLSTLTNDNNSRTALSEMITHHRRELDRDFRKLSVALAEYDLTLMATTAEHLRRTAAQLQHFDLADALKAFERLAITNADRSTLYAAMDPIIELMPRTRKPTKPPLDFAAKGALDCALN